MKANNTGSHVKQCSAADAHGQCQEPTGGRSSDAEKPSSIPSLLETLRAAAAAAEDKARKKPVKEETCAEPRSQEMQEPAPRPPTSQLSEDTQFATEPPLNKAGKSGLQSLAVKRSSLKHKASLPGPESPSTPCSASAQARQRMIHKARTDLKTLEETIPWDAVHDSWKESRQPWRKSLRQAETVAELLNAMNDLRKALALEKSVFSHQGVEWNQQLRTCIENNASIEEVLQLLTELRSNAKNWSKSKPKESMQPFEGSKEQKAAALQGLEALWRATQNGSSALMQCPLEAILDYDPDVLKVLRRLLEKEMALPAAAGKDASKVHAASAFLHLQSKPRMQRYSPLFGISSSGETCCDPRLLNRPQ